MPNITEIKIKKIYKKDIALALREKGFNIIGTEPNRCRPQYDVYMFHDTESFERGLTEVMSSRYINNK